MRFRPILRLCAGLILVAALLPWPNGTIHATAPQKTRTISLTMEYEKRDVYAGRLQNSKAAFELLQAFFDSKPFERRVTYSFLKDVLKNTMRADEGFVHTPLGFGYGACGAPSLLNYLVRTATFIDSDGEEKPVFEARRWKRERSPTYGKFGVAIFLDLQGDRSTDYRWRLNPAYDGPEPEITIEFEDTSPQSAIVTITMVYGDEPPAQPG